MGKGGSPNLKGGCHDTPELEGHDVSFVLCVAWGLVVPREWHPTQLLEFGLPGFRWISPRSFVLGLVESIVIGVYVGALFTAIFNFVSRRIASAGRP